MTKNISTIKDMHAAILKAAREEHGVDGGIKAHAMALRPDGGIKDVITAIRDREESPMQKAISQMVGRVKAEQRGPFSR